ncbi:MAG TPA: hypothetical protein DEE98_03445 [Elusimicrobia bacterium]|nr:MAG: Radical SAM domain protein [Parcubacteria group bacterium GW2011_GWB1_41_6]KKS34572.1 MAG: Radical SAM domain protein [Parcubacteria group bacterium GW2011_GWC2_42_13]KKS73257.1 MAG: Radical SAM domain protein [Parcubacteria group bacterium GW2011_GWF2_42_7]HBU69420.1 hypothetical protein [Elusimicrobiota bacterium]
MVLLISINQQDVEILKKAPTDISAFGVRHISSYLKSKGEECKIIFLVKKHGQLETEKELKEIENFVTKINPDVIGVSLMSNHYLRAVKITKDLKRYYSRPVVWGGIHPTIRPEECLNWADLVFIGEAEHSFFEFYQEHKNGVQNHKTKGIVYKKEGKILNNGIYPLCGDLNSLPFCDYDLNDHYVFSGGKLVQMNFSLLRSFLPFSQAQYRIITTRGCPFNCAYCGSAFLKGMYEGKFLRTRTVDNVLEELGLALKKYPYIQFIKIMDDCFTINSLEWLKDFAEQYKEKINLPFFCLVSPSTITEEKLGILIDAGLENVQVGLQSGSDRTNKNIYSRYISQEQFFKAISILDSFRKKLSFSFDVISDNPYEKEEDYAETAKLLNQIPRPFNLTLYSLTFYPGTELYNRAQKEGMIGKDSQEYITKQFHLLKNNYFNKLFRIIPVLSKNQVNCFIEKRDRLAQRIRLNLYYTLYRRRNILPVGLKSFLKKIVK